MAQRATSLGPKPSLFLFGFVFFLFVFLLLFMFFFLFLFGGFKGQVRWPKGAPHLVLNPPCFLFVFFVFVFPCLPFFVSVNRPKNCFPRKKRAFLVSF